MFPLRTMGTYMDLSIADLQALVKKIVVDNPQGFVPYHSHRLLRLPAVLDRVGISRSQWFLLISLGRAPPPVPLGERSRAWVESEVQAWIAQRIAARNRETI